MSVKIMSLFILGSTFATCNIPFAIKAGRNLYVADSLKLPDCLSHRGTNLISFLPSEGHFTVPALSWQDCLEVKLGFSQVASFLQGKI